ncbi:MAG: type II secretion system F family protein [Nocardioidaceae bacterium]
MAAVLVGACVWAVVPGSARLRSPVGTAGSALRITARPGVLLAMSAPVAAVLLIAVGPRVTVLGLVGFAISLASRRLVVAGRTRAMRRRRQEATIGLCDALAAELCAGVPASVALERSCREGAEWLPIRSAEAIGAEVVTEMRRAAATPGAEGLRSIAAGWEVAHRSGAALASVLERVAVALRAEQDAQAEVVASLAAPRATAKMLAVLPMFGIALGFSLGVNPLAFLVQTTPGICCLLAGVTLAFAGLWWVERLATAAEVRA